MPNKWNLDGVAVDVNDNMTITGDCTVSGDLSADLTATIINVAGIATSDPSVAGQVWSDSGVLTVSAG